MPAHIIDGGRAIIQPVCKWCDLVKRPAFGNFFKSTVNITYGGRSFHNPLAIQFQDILKHTMRSRVRWPQVKRGGLLFQTSFR